MLHQVRLLHDGRLQDVGGEDDLLHLLHSLPQRNRGILTTSIYPLLDLLEKHSLAFLSSNLPPATNELFKLILNNYNSTHKFKGKV